MFEPREVAREYIAEFLLGEARSSLNSIMPQIPTDVLEENDKDSVEEESKAFRKSFESTVRSSLTSAQLRSYKNKYPRNNVRVQHSMRITYRIFNLLFETVEGVESGELIVDQLNALERIKLVRVEVERMKEVNLLPMWLRASPSISFLFLRCVLFDVFVRYKIAIVFSGVDPETTGMRKVVQEQHSSIELSVNEVKGRFKSILVKARKAFIERWDVEIPEEMQGTDGVKIGDIEEMCESLGQLATSLNEVCPVLYVIEEDLRHQIESTWVFESGAENSWKWKNPYQQKHKDGIIFTEVSQGRHVFTCMRKTMKMGEETERFRWGALTEISALSIVNDMCEECAKGGVKAQNYGYLAEGSLEIRNVPLQRHIFGVWDALFRSSRSFLDGLCAKHKVGIENLETDRGTLNYDWWEGKPSGSRRYCVQREVILPSLVAALLFESDGMVFEDCARRFQLQLIE